MLPRCPPYDLSITQTPLTDLNATDIVRQAKEERQACNDRLSARIEKKLEGRVASFLKLHKIDYHIRQAANHGLNEVRIPIQPKFRGALTSPNPLKNCAMPSSTSG